MTKRVHYDTVSVDISKLYGNISAMSSGKIEQDSI